VQKEVIMARERNTSNADVETITSDEGEVIESGPEATATEPKAKKEPARGQLPDGYVTPVGLAHELGKRGLQKNKAGEVLVTVPPQMVYSYMRNASKDDAFPVETVTDSIGKERQALKLDEGIAWWERKNTRAQERKDNAATKAAAKAEKAANKPADEVTESEGEPAVEAE
jgi:hypothetical protein